MLTTAMAYASSDEMMFGTSLHPVTARRGLVIGGGQVIPEAVPHPRPGSERSLETLLREFEKANGDVLARCVDVGHPALVLENEHVFQMTHDPRWGMEVAAQTARQIDDFRARYGLQVAYRATIADIRKPNMFHLRSSDRTRQVLESFEACAQHADIVSIESIGGKEIHDYCIIRGDVAGLLFASLLGCRDMEWLWPQIVAIAGKHGCIPGGDTNCAQATSAMFMAGGLTAKGVPHTLAALVRAMGIGRSLVAYECGATGPGKDCAYENPILKAITGKPMSTEGKTSACAHLSLCGNVMAAVCDLWANEAVEYHEMFGGTAPAVFAEMLGYDAAAMNAAIELGYQRELQACLVRSDRYRSPHGFMLCPDNAWILGKTVVSHGGSYYARARAAALACGELLLGDPLLRLTRFETESLRANLKVLEGLPESEGDFLDQSLGRFAKVTGFDPGAYGL